jgi:ubiquinone/menaquinone biosynthesis C-methylase UbiE
MSGTLPNEQLAANAFSKQSMVFDALYRGNTIIQYKRDRVREHVRQFIPATGKILELNSGTGEDAIFFAGLGYQIHATDISESMQEVLRQKVKQKGFARQVSTENCSFTRLTELRDKGPYDLIFSNFAGLNCTNALDQVLSSFPALLKPGGIVTLVILPKFCLWETLLIAKGKWKTATRRWFAPKGRQANVEGISFTCWYHNPSAILKKLGNDFRLLGLEGLCSIVPPSYIEHFPENHPRAWKYLQAKENRYKGRWPWRSIGDYYILSAQKKNKLPG